ncbi:hypothetical protein MCEMSEM18_00111 [Comamonadaceae bacterium]
MKPGYTLLYVPDIPVTLSFYELAISANCRPVARRLRLQPPPDEAVTREPAGDQRPPSLL